MSVVGVCWLRCIVGFAGCAWCFWMSVVLYVGRLFAWDLALVCYFL